jgi:3-oxoadipate enol-lactonase
LRELKSDTGNITDGHAVTRDGTRLGFTLYQGSEERRVALIHSIGMDRNFWRPTAERLAPDASTLIYDGRGHGASDKPPGPYSVDLFADDLADLLDHIGWQSAAIGGASMGGCVALAFAAAYRARTSALALIDTTAWYGADAPKQWAERAEKAKRDGLDSLVEFQKTRWFGDRFRADNPDIVEHCVNTFLANDLPAYAESCRMLGTADMRAALPRLGMRTAIVVGEEDYATPLAMAQALRDGITGSSLSVLPGARHLTPLEVPDRIANELCRLMDSTR